MVSVKRARPFETSDPCRSGTFATAPRGDDDRSLDAYDPEEDIVAPLSVRASFMELLWICGDCGEHYPRAQACPDGCSGCGAPRQHFYAHVED